MGIGIDPGDFALLKKMGRDMAGALTVIPEEECPEQNGAPQVLWLENETFAGHLRSLPRKPLLFDEAKGISLSLAGVNAKTAVVAGKRRAGLPQNGFPSSHIVKADIPGLEDSIRTEQFCLDVARGTGLRVPKSKIMTVEDQTFMIMARYDRVMKNGSLRRVHQEDFCQALGIMPAKKYQRRGGPGWPECFDLLRHSSNPASDRTSLLEYAIFQYLCGNPDAHAKNYALVYRGGAGGVRLSPLYDLNNAAAHRHNFKKTRPVMAMRIGKQDNSGQVTAVDWRQFASECGFSEDIVIRIVRVTASHILQALPEALARQPGCEAVIRAEEDIRERCMKWWLESQGNLPVP